MGILLIHDVVKKMKKSLISLTILTSIVATAILAQEFENLEQLPFCGDEYSRTISRRLLYVTTLDGKLTALDLARKGKVHWELPTEPGPLISSSIHRLELTNNGQLVRMIPSLSGGIYKFDGETINPIPITVENLLSSSFKFSDDLVISGGKETRSYGVSARTGQILYECSMSGCINDTTRESTESSKTANDNNFISQEHDSLLDDVVVVRRQTQTVRAIEPRTGNERWNFSVGQHEIEVLKSEECHDRPLNKLDLFTLDLNIKVIVPEGIICAFSKSTPNLLLWKHQFEHPIVSAWKTDSNDEIKTIDLFGSAQWIWNSGQDEIIREGLIAPSIYLGMYQKQLYIQESLKLQKLLTDKTNPIDYHLVENGNTNLPTIPWRPLPATKSTSIIMIENNENNYYDEYGLIEHDEKTEATDSVTALSVLYASEYVNGNGFYLFTQKDLNKSSTALCTTNNSTNDNNDTNDFLFEFNDSETQVKIIIISMWYWWKEILVISLTTGLLLNILFSPKVRSERQVVVIERHIAVPTALEATEEFTNSFSQKTQRSVSESTNNTNNDNFTSRFQTDFDMVQCLGKGGFGVVFEAKNKLDSCTYAVKRITLPNKKEKRERVMREVKTLATSEHPNIVRYFQAWVEASPPGWQEIEDVKWSKRDFSTTSIEIETPDGTTLPSFPKNSNYYGGGDCADNNKSNLNSWISKIDENKHSSIWNNNYNGKCNAADYEDDYSFIQFKSDSNDKSNKDSFSIDIHSKDSFDSKNSKIKNHKSIDEQDDSDSFEIEFQHSENHNEIDQNDNINEIHWNSNCNDSELSKSLSTPSKKLGHKRPLSLDLSRSGLNKSALIPLYQSRNNKLLPEISKSQQQILNVSQKPIQNKHYLYIQMQLCRKESLREWLREHCIEMREPHIQSIFHQIVDAVDYVHRRNLIHRDLKPSNIFFSLDGQIRIGDFGLVTDMPETPSCSSSSDISSVNVLKLSTFRHTQQVGTHLYMSPEQLQGHSYDNSVDIYSLGLIFFELLVYFSTEMERIKTLKGLRDGQFPNDFPNLYPEEHDLLKLMLSTKATDRPATNIIKDKLFSMTSWINEQLKNVDSGKIRRLSEMSSAS